MAVEVTIFSDLIWDSHILVVCLESVLYKHPWFKHRDTRMCYEVRQIALALNSLEDQRGGRPNTISGSKGNETDKP